MTVSATAAPASVTHSVAAYPVAALRVISGANAGDATPLPEDSILGDYYRLQASARPARLVLALEAQSDTQAGTLAPGTELGRAGQSVRLQGRISLMAPDGDLVEVLLLALGPDNERIALPMAPLLQRHTYTLIAVDPTPGPIRLADIVAGAFARGTLIALADGRQVPVEDLALGDAVITRDHGAQPLRWKGTVSLRAEGVFAPITVQPGVMGNLRPLTVSPYHRLFLYRRAARDIAGASGLLVQARHLVDDSAILRREGGVVEYFSLVFDAHEVIYAEGVPCESLMVCPAVLTRLPEDLAQPLQNAFPGLSQSHHSGAMPDQQVVSRLRDRPGVFP